MTPDDRGQARFGGFVGSYTFARRSHIFQLPDQKGVPAKESDMSMTPLVTGSPESDMFMETVRLVLPSVTMGTGVTVMPSTQRRRPAGAPVHVFHEKPCGSSR